MAIICVILPKAAVFGANYVKLTEAKTLTGLCNKNVVERFYFLKL